MNVIEITCLLIGVYLVNDSVIFAPSDREALNLYEDLLKCQR